MLKIIYFIFAYLILSVSSNAEIIKIFDFTEKEFSELKVKKVRGADNKTLYSLGSNKNGNFLKSIADNAAWIR